MARYYQTADPQFVDNFIYTPPYELMLQVAGKKQAQYDQAISSARLLGDVKIDHLNGEYDTANVLEKQRYYNDRANSIIEGIRKDPLNVNGYIGEIDNLQKELKTDFSTGEISKFTGSKAAYTKWEEENKELLKKNPGRYQAARNAFFNSWGGDSVNSQWKGQAVTDDLDWNKYIDSAEKLKATVVKGQTSTPTGTGYIVDNEGKEEIMDEQRLKAFILSKVMNPTDLQSLRQSQQFGLGKYFSDDEMTTLDFEAPGFNNINLASKAMAYHNKETSTKYSEDGTYNSAQQRALTYQMHAEDQAWQREKTQIEQAGQNARTKEEGENAKAIAYQTKIAEYMAEGEYGKAAELSKLFDQSRGGTGSATSKTGSRYADFNVLAAKAKNDPAAKKLIEQTLPTALREAGLNFNDPTQAKIAKEITDKVILGTLNPKDIGNYIEKKIPVNKQINPSQNSKIEQIAKRDYNERVAPIKNDISNIQSKIQEQKNLIASYNSNKAYAQPGQEGNKQKVIAKANQTIQQLQGQLKTVNNKLQGVTMSTSMQKAKGIVLNSSPDLNATKRKDLVNVFEQGFKNATQTFGEKRNFNTYYETSPSDAIASSRILTMFSDPNFKKEFTAEVIDKNGKSTWKDMDQLGDIEFTTYEGFAKTGPLGTPMAVLKGSDGKIYNVTANANTPQMKHLVNTAVNGMTNPQSQVAFQEILIPEAGQIINTMQALKLKGKNSGRQPMKFNGRDVVLEYDASGRVNLYDPLKSSTKPLFSNPVNPLEAGKYLNSLTK